MAAKKKQEAAEMLKSIRLEKVIGRIDHEKSLEISAHQNRKLWMVPAMKAVFCESKHPVTNRLVVTKMNMDRFLTIEFIPLEEDIVIDNPLVKTDPSVEVPETELSIRSIEDPRV